MTQTRSNRSRNISGYGSRTQRGWVANTRAPKRSYAIPASSPVGGRGRAKYPIDSLPRARNALARVHQHGTPREQAMVHAAVKRRYPALARRSTVIATPTDRRTRRSGRNRTRR